MPFCPFKFSRYCWQALAIFLVLFALGVSLIRGLLPQLGQVRQQVAIYLQDEYQLKLQLGQISAQWEAFGPALTVDNLVIPPQESLPVTLIVGKVQIKLDFWQTLLTASPQVETVIFNGVHLALDLDALGQSGEPQSSANTDWLYRLLLEQLGRFSLSDVRLQLLSAQHHFPPLYIKDLKWRNTGARHQGSGILQLAANASSHESLSLSLDIDGDANAPDSLTGQIYLAAKSLDLGEWASRQANPKAPGNTLPLQGVVNLEAWVTLAQRKIESGLVQFEPSWLQWSLDNQEQKFAIQGGTIAWRPDAQGWRVQSQGLDFVTNGVAWPALTLAAKQSDDELFAYLSPLDTRMLLPLLPLFPGVDAASLRHWQALQPEGEIGPLRLYRHGGEALQASVDIAQLGWHNAAGLPGSAPLDATLGWRGQTLYFSAPPQSYELSWKEEFQAPIHLDAAALQGQFDVEHQALSLSGLQLENEDLALDANLRLDLSDGALLALAARLQLKNAANAKRYFPRHGMGEPLVDYLGGAIQAGKIEDAKLLWHGQLSNFPYEDHSGVFQADFNLTQAKYRFQPDWPAVTDLSLAALFENARMDLWVDKGQLLQVPADGAHVYIPHLGHESVLKVQADLTTQGAAATQVLQASPLAASVGATLETVQIQDRVSANLDLTIPLYLGGEPDIRGRVQFDKTPVYLRQPGVQLEAVTGEVRFANELVEGQDIGARLFQQAVTLSFDTERVNRDLGLNLKINGSWDLAALPDSLDNPLSAYYSGRLDWTGGMTLVFAPEGYRLQASVGSDLSGVGLSLPGAFGKLPQEARRFNVDLVGDSESTSLDIILGDQAEFWGGFDSASAGRLTDYHLLLGRLFQPGDEVHREGGYLQLALDEVEFQPWLPLIRSFLGKGAEAEVAQSEPGTPSATATQSQAGAFPPLKAVEARIAKLDLLGQALTDLSFDAAPQESGWRFNAKANEFEGWIDFYPDWLTQGLKVVAQKFDFAPQAQQSPAGNSVQDQAQLLANLPPVAIDVDAFNFYDKPFGHLVLQARPEGEAYHIQTLSLTTPDASLQGQGYWKVRQGESLTQVTLTLKADKFDTLTDRLGLSPGLQDAPLDLTASLSWRDAPYAFSLESLGGKVRFDFGKGHLSEISDKGARIFSLFSLDSLLRKLSLDFSDVFGKGLYFDAFKGDLLLENGVVKTTNTAMDAVAGDMKVRGYTDLISQSLNYDIRFVPQLASSVPTVVLLSTSAWTLGLGAFALTKVLEPVIEVISEIRFRLTGTMDDPKLEELERKSKEIEIPESILPRKPAVAADAPAEAGTEAVDKAPASEGTQPVQPETPTPAEPEPKKELKSEPQPESKSKPEPELKHESEPAAGQVPVALRPANAILKLVGGIDAYAREGIPGDKDADQLVTMPEQPRCGGQSGVYRIAA
nr:YhdP family protein [Shewanella salipaludis]